MNDAEMISIQSHTIGSIGQALKAGQDIAEVKRIYDGYIKRLNELLNRGV